ncbi:hypothetical protein AC578_5672 [Pseudocercospora eumusae]|uniref:Uncharacterized protein n=1 Tax=Pseudocercospora eumusae TaxID=321146 RepID=A0A139H3B2_9PEZI|nr:hypothetical protein AC578_5672 [Pseudocercospora eumusae]
MEALKRQAHGLRLMMHDDENNSETLGICPSNYIWQARTREIRAFRIAHTKNEAELKAGANSSGDGDGLQCRPILLESLAAEGKTSDKPRVHVDSRHGLNSPMQACFIAPRGVANLEKEPMKSNGWTGRVQHTRAIFTETTTLHRILRCRVMAHKPQILVAAAPHQRRFCILGPVRSKKVFTLRTLNMLLAFTKEWYECEGKNIHYACTVVVDSKPSPTEAEPGWNSVQSRRTHHRITYESPPRWEQQEREQQVAVQYQQVAVHDSPATNAAPSVFLQEQGEDKIELDFSQSFRSLGNASSSFRNPAHHNEPQPALPSAFRLPQARAPSAPALQPSLHQQQHPREHHLPEHYHYYHHNQPRSADHITYALAAPPPIEPARCIAYTTASPAPPPPPHLTHRPHRNSYTPRMSGPFAEESVDDALFVGGPSPFPQGYAARPPADTVRVPEETYTDHPVPPTHHQAPQKKRGPTLEMPGLEQYE